MFKLKQAIQKILLMLLAAIVLLAIAMHTLFRQESYELDLLINKYTDLNISQNAGMHRYALIIIKKVSLLLPKKETPALNRTQTEIGNGPFESKDHTKRYQIARQKFVTNTADVLTALRDSLPGTEIIVMPGIYKFSGIRLEAPAQGDIYRPIVLKAHTLGEVIFEMATQEGFFISGPFWHIENIIFKGIPESDSWIEHAIHMVGQASNIVIANNIFVNFNSHIKSNGVKDKNGKVVFPSNVTVIHNNFYNEWKRVTDSPTTPIDVVGGDNWKIIDNFIADFGRTGHQGKGGVSYGAFLKGAGTNGLMQGNLVACSWRVPYSSTKDIRIGLSLGGGGTGKNFCADSACDFEHDRGVIRENSIINCLNDVGIYLNKAKNTEIFNNRLVNTSGIDVRYPISNARIYNNMHDGRIRARDGAALDAFDNLIE